MAAFDPDAYLAEKPFDPDAYLGQTKQSRTPIMGSLMSGALRGAGEIGSTILRVLPNAIGGDTAEESAQRRKSIGQAIDQLNEGLGVSAPLETAGKLGAEIAGTAGVGGVLARGASLIPGVATKAAPVIEALRTAGMSAGGATGLKGVATRALAGAGVGAGSAALINPSDAGMGAAMGGTIAASIPVAKLIGQVGTKMLGGSTGVGEEALNQAYRAGKEGNLDFKKALRGQSDITDVLGTAKQNLENMVAQKQDAYRKGMVNIKNDATVLDLSGIDKSLGDAVGMVTYKGQVKNDKAAQTLEKVASVIDEWKKLPAADYHTPEGLDALKQRIGGILEEIPYEQKTARTAVGKVYDSVKGEITKQAPEYASVMKGYSEASDTIKEIERALSLGEKSSADTAMRKLQSLMRNNVNTSYGYRNDLASKLEQAGGQEIMPALAGQSLSAYAPRGIQRALSGTGSAGLALSGNLPTALGLGLVSSPRLVGEAYQGAGKLADLVSKAGNKVSGGDVSKLAALLSQVPQRAYLDSAR